MCNIWKTEGAGDLDAALLEKLPATLRYVNISGGEPFLRQDLSELAAAVLATCPRAQIIISSNGLVLEKRVRETMAELQQTYGDRVGLAVSVDGIGNTHDRIRGIPGAFERVLALVKGLKEDGVTNLRLAFTAVDENVSDFHKVYRFSRDLEVEFTSAIAQGSSHYFQASNVSSVRIDDLREQLNKVAASELSTLSPKRWARAYFGRGLYEFARGSGRPLSCHAANDFFFMSPAGTIYACNILDIPLGNLRDVSFEEIWTSAQAVEARRRVAECSMGCWMVCTARSAMKRSPLKVAGWVAANKARAMRGKPVL
jgi:radical SAM protein with 4Fe4S-binding SPASM domain